MNPQKLFLFSSYLSSCLVLSACGYSQEEWDLKVRETNELRGQLAGAQRACAIAEADYADAVEESDAPRLKVSERRMNMFAFAAVIESEKRALTEYEQRKVCLKETRARIAYLTQWLHTNKQL